MAFTYDASLPTDRDWIRFRIGDVDSSWPVGLRLEDEEIDFVLAEAGHRRDAALRCARALRARFARAVDTDNTGLRVAASQRFAQLGEVIRELEAEVGATGRPLWEKPTDPAGNERSPAFSVGMHDYLGA